MQAPHRAKQSAVAAVAAIGDSILRAVRSHLDVGHAGQPLPEGMRAKLAVALAVLVTADAQTRADGAWFSRLCGTAGEASAGQLARQRAGAADALDDDDGDADMNAAVLSSQVLLLTPDHGKRAGPYLLNIYLPCFPPYSHDFLPSLPRS
jgi:hypothetical protein